MNLFEEVMSLEISTEEFYRNLIANCDYNTDIKKILNLLADDTKHHIKRLLHLNQVMGLESRNSDFFLKAKGIFHALQKKRNFGVCDLDQIGTYEHVLATQKNTIVLYEEMISNTRDVRQKEILNDIFDSKRKHVILLANILELLLQPEQWVENGEFNHLEAY